MILLNANQFQKTFGLMLQGCRLALVNIYCPFFQIFHEILNNIPLFDKSFLSELEKAKRSDDEKDLKHASFSMHVSSFVFVFSSLRFSKYKRAAVRVCVGDHLHLMMREAY